MNKYLSRKFIAMLLAGASNMAVLFGAPEAIKDQVPVVLGIIDAIAGLYIFVEGWIDKTRAYNGR